MVRNYQRTPGSKPYRNFREEDMEKAVQAVRNGMSQKTAAQTYKVPRITLGRRVHEKHTKPVGHPTVLSPAEEATIASTLGVVAKWGFPLTRLDIRDVVKKYLDKQGKAVSVFKDNVPGPDFLDAFMLRNNLTIRTASNIKRSRSSVNRDDILNFFNNAELALKDVKSKNLYNYDETNVTDDPGAKKVIVPRNTKRVERVQEHSRATISIMVCGNAHGDLLPPMVVYKALNLYDNWTQGGPAGTRYASSASGWFDMNLFETWFFKILLPHVEATRGPDDTVILLGDNLASHFSPKVIESCRANKIYLSPFPANATHLMQPLDVAVFGPMKKKWREILDKWRRETRYPGSIPKEQFPLLLDRLWNGISDTVSKNLVSGFRATGLHPAKPDEVLKRIPDGFNGDGEDIGRTIDVSLRELLQEHRGSGEKQKRKRGKKVEPGTNASAENPEQRALDVEEVEPEIPLAIEADIPASTNQNEHSAAINQNEPSTSNVKMRLPVRQTRKAKRVDSSTCGVCRINWKHYKGKLEWIKCVKCSCWICGLCNEGSKDPYYNCPRCEDSSDEEMVDDSDGDKNFNPADY